MKRLLFIFMMLITTTIFAQYKVVSTQGQVEQETSPGIWRNVTVGMTLKDDDFIRTGIASSLIMTAGLKTFSIGSATQGLIMDIIHDSTIRVRGNISHTDTSHLARSHKQVATASARASDAAHELEFHE